MGSKVEGLEAENAKLGAYVKELKLAEVETSKLRENVKQLKLQVKKLEELVITSKPEESSCPSQKKEKKVHPRSKMIRTTSTKDPNFPAWN